MDYVWLARQILPPQGLTAAAYHTPMILSTGNVAEENNVPMKSCAQIVM
jgi:hypothetical protein